jgi:uncharacterized protein (DUF488 family)
MVGTLYTLGYAGLRDANDVRALLGDRVELVVDVRMRTYSGNRAFSTGTRRTVEEAGYSYRHLAGLGNAEYRTGGIRLARPDDIARLVDLLAISNVAIMCACREIASCHRRLVASMAAERVPGLEVFDL